MGAPGSLAVLDLEMRDSKLVSKTYRYIPSSTNSNLVVTWRAMKRPRGFKSVAGGVIYVRNLRGYKKDSYTAEIARQNDRFSWSEPSGPAGVMLVAVLPRGYIIPSVEDASPTLFEARTFKNRVAIYWQAWGRYRVEFSWHMREGQYATEEDLADYCSQLNEEASNKRGQEGEEPPHPVSIVADAPARSGLNIVIAVILGVCSPLSGVFGNLAATHTPPSVFAPLLQYAWFIFIILALLWFVMAIWQPLASRNG